MKRTFDEIRQLILRELCQSQQTINNLSTKTGINWRTVLLHLNFLESKNYVREVVNSNYVRIFEITTQGRDKCRNPVRKVTPELQVEVAENLGYEKVQIK